MSVSLSQIKGVYAIAKFSRLLSMIVCKNTDCFAVKDKSLRSKYFRDCVIVSIYRNKEFILCLSCVSWS